MPGTTGGLRTDAAPRIAELERQRPEWHGWLRLLGGMRRALDDAAGRRPWADVEFGAGEASTGAAPLLHGRTLAVDAGRVQRLVRRLAVVAAAGTWSDPKGAASLRRCRPSRTQALELILAAVRRERAAIGRVAAALGIDAGALAALADLAAIPVLVSCGLRLGAEIPSHWPNRYCPVCGGTPVLVEQRGLDRTRWPRCGRCGGQWQVEWLCCIHCGEREHERLGSLVPEDGGEVLKVETCASCRGYLKSLATLQPLSPLELLLQDLETVELDLVSLARGYRRPDDGGFPLEVTIVPRTSHVLWRHLGVG